MNIDVKVPSPGESISEVEIAEWFASSGDYVKKDQEIVELNSDKATLAICAEESGVISIIVGDGETIEVGQVIATINTDARSPEENEKKETKTPDKELESKEETPYRKETYARGIPSPTARKILHEKSIDPKNIIGTGKNNRVTKNDAVKAQASMGSPDNARKGYERKRMSLLRRKLAQRLVSVKNETAMLTTFNEIDMSVIFELRNKYKGNFKETHGVSLGFMSFFTKAVINALKEFPQINSMIDGDDLVVFDHYDISIAVSGPKGLMVPVVRNAENLSFAAIEKEIKRLANRVRKDEITTDEMTGGTFTITNGGVFGSMLSTPILNPPQSAILGMHNIVERPIAIKGKIDIRPIMYVALSYDHRIIDGRESVGVLVKIKEVLENPIEHLMSGDNLVEKTLEL